MKTIRLFPTSNFPLVEVACRDCPQHSGEDCPICDNLESVLVDEVLESDVVYDEPALELNLAAREAHFAPIRAAQIARHSWPPRVPSAADHLEIVEMQRAYMGALSELRAPKGSP